MVGQTFELLEAARWRGLSWDAFDALDVDEQARIVAHYRTALRIQAVDAWAHRPTPGDAGGKDRGRARRRK